MKKIDKMNDKLFKVVFSDIKNVKPLLHSLLPEAIKKFMDWSKLTMDPTNHVSKRYREGYSDMVAKTKIQNVQGEKLDLDIYFLFEHKSTNEKDTPIQILGYKHLAWSQDSSQGKPLRLIIPIVFYHGQEKWTVPIHFNEHFKVADEIKPYLLDFQYLLFDTVDWDFDAAKHQELNDNVFLLTALALMKSTYDKDWESIRAIFRFWLERGFVDQTDDIIFFMIYISETKSVDLEYLGKLLEETELDGGDIMLTLADRLRKEGRQEARKDFIHEGEIQGKLKLAHDLMKRGISIDVLTKSTGFSKEDIENFTIQND